MTQTLLKTDDVASELAIEPWAVNRLVARGVLRANTVGGGELRFDPADVRQAAASDDLEPPRLFQGWLDSRDLKFRADQLETAIRKHLVTIVPEEDPGENQVIGFVPEIRVAANQETPAPRIQTPGVTMPPQLKHCLAIVKLRWVADGLLRRRRSANPMKRVTASSLSKLYSDGYNEIVDEAWELLQDQSISIGEAYPSDVPGRPIRRSFSFRLGSLDVTQSQIVDWAF